MAFPQRNNVLEAIGVKAKPNAPQAPRSLRDSFMGSSSTPSADPSASPDTDPAAIGAKASREDAGFIPAGQICGACEYFTKESGECAKVEGAMQAHDSCKNFFEAANGDQGQATDTDDMGMTSGMSPANQDPGAGALRGV